MALTKISTGGVKDDAASQAKIADEAIDEARLQISNAGSNGQFLSKQSGNTGGLTWATVSVPDSDKIEEGNTSVETVDTGSDGNVSIKTEGTERVKIRNDGVVDIGGSNGAANVNLNVKGTSGTGNVDTGNIGKVNIASSHSNVPNAENIVFGQLHFGHAGNAFGPYIEGASGGLWSTNNLPSALKFYTVPASSTTQTERFRISKDGSLGVGGANYGTSGQVLTSGGNAAAPSWAAVPPGGNSIDMVADGAIAAGKACIIKSNGKAKQVQLEHQGKDGIDFSNSNSGTFGNHFTDLDVHGGETRLAFDPTTKKIVHICKDTTNGDIWYQIGTQNSSNSSGVDWTTKVKIWDDNENNYYETSDLVYAGNSRFLYIWTLNSGVTKVKIGKATSSGFSWSSEINLYGTDTVFRGINAVKLTDDRVALVSKFMQGSGPSGLEASHPALLVLDITSDTAFSYRNFTQLDTSTCLHEKERNTLSYDSTNGILFATWETDGADGGTAGLGRCCALKVASGTSATITKSSSNVQIDTDIDKQDACYHSGANKFLVTYGTSWNGSNGDIDTKVATVNSTSLAITIATGATISSNYPLRGLKILEGTTPESGSTNNQIFITWIASTQKMYMNLSNDFTGGSFSFENPTSGREITAHSGGWYYFEQAYIPDLGTGKNLIVASGGGIGDLPAWHSYPTTTSSLNLTSNNQNFLGFAEDAINDGATGTIKLEGNVVGNQSGLTPGTFYSINGSAVLASGVNEGSHTTSIGGYAVASDKIRIKAVEKA